MSRFVAPIELLRPGQWCRCDDHANQIMIVDDAGVLGRHIGVIGLGTGVKHVPAGRRLLYLFRVKSSGRGGGKNEFSYQLDWVRTSIIVGDGQKVDAFSGDAIPTHLLTKEAFELYRSRLKSDGVLAIHISNRFSIYSL